MPSFAHSYTDDPIGLAGTTDAGPIILADVRGGLRQQFVEVFAANAAYIAAAAKAIKPLSQFQIDYELLATASLVLPLGALLEDEFVISGITANCDSGSHPKVTVTVLSFSDAAKYLVTQTGSITITGGFGLVNKFGATFSKGISSSLSVSMQQAEAMEETSGDFLDEGFTHYGMKKAFTIQAFDAITLPVGNKQTAADLANTGRTAWGTQSASWFQYI